jgi:hypothetical protein
VSHMAIGIRIATGVLLLAAGTLKFHQLWYAGGNSLGLSAIVDLALPVAEVALALWLVLGKVSRRSSFTAAVCFVVFGAFSLSQALAGRMSCGCFGVVHVSPRLTFAVDALCAGGLLITLPHASRPNASSRQSAGSRLYRPAIALLVMTAIAAAVWTAANLSSKAIIALNGFHSGQSLAVFDPARSVGLPLGMIDSIDIAPQLSKGNWTVVFYRHDCPHCFEVSRKYERMALEPRTDSASPRVALIELPPFGRNKHQSSSAYVSGRLSESTTWFIQTPVVVQLADGHVTSVISEPEI